MNPADAELIELIQQVTRGGTRFFVTLARHGKALERDDPQRAAFLLAAVRTHPLYKGGRLAFDMLEVEDLMLDGSPVDLMNTHEMVQVLSAGAHYLAETLRQMGAHAQSGSILADASTRDTDVPGGPDRALAQSADETTAATSLPRVSIGPEDELTHPANASTVRDEGRHTKNRVPELRSSDYLFDFVVLGLLDLSAGAGFVKLT